MEEHGGGSRSWWEEGRKDGMIGEGMRKARGGKEERGEPKSKSKIDWDI